MSVQSIPVETADAGVRLDRWFRRHFPSLTQGALQKMLRTGQVRVDGKRAEGNTRLAAGQEVRVPPMPSAPPPPPPIRISAEDEAMISLAHVQGQMRASSLQGLARMVESNPDETLVVLRRWLSPQD